MVKSAASAKFVAAAVFALATLLGVMKPGAAEPFMPSFWDPGLRLDRPDLSGVRAIRFLTADDYPPLNFALADGTLAGFNVEIARAICEELDIGCTIQARRFDTLIDSLDTGKGDAVSPRSWRRRRPGSAVDFSSPYYQTPARFVARKGKAPATVSAAALAGKTIGVVAGSSHQAYLETFFPEPSPNPTRTFWRCRRLCAPGRSRRRSATG